MIALLRTYLAPYKAALALVVGLLVVQALATLYLPALNGDIINNGVAKGDTTYILQTGALMLGISAVVVVASIIAVYWGSKTGMAFGRDVRGAIFRKVESFSQAELNHFGTPSLITRNTNDVQQVQMTVLIGLNMMIIAPILAVGGIILALRQDVPLAGILVVILPLMAAHRRIADVPRAAAVPGRPAQGRPHQPGHPRGAQRHPRHPRVRPDDARGGAVRGREPGPDGDLAPGQPPVRADDPDADGDLQPVVGRHPVVRRHPRVERRDADRQPHRVPAVRHADPVRGDDGRLHVHPGPASGRLVGPDPGGPPDRSIDQRPGRRRRRRRPDRAPSTSATSSSATRAPRTRSCATSRSGSSPARPPPSWAARAAARARWSTSSRASTT